jgi:ribosomal protein S18 acetylase RimI-like enzyme
MTTTELIALLKAHEFGASGRPKEILLEIESDNKKVTLAFYEKHKFVVTGGGDGIAGAQLNLEIRKSDDIRR